MLPDCNLRDNRALSKNRSPLVRSTTSALHTPPERSPATKSKSLIDLDLSDSALSKKESAFLPRQKVRAASFSPCATPSPTKRPFAPRRTATRVGTCGPDSAALAQKQRSASTTRAHSERSLPEQRAIYPNRCTAIPDGNIALWFQESALPGKKSALGREKRVMRALRFRKSPLRNCICNVLQHSNSLFGFIGPLLL